MCFSIFPLTIKFRDMNTGEIRLVDYDDEVGFDECMGNENMQLAFD